MFKAKLFDVQYTFLFLSAVIVFAEAETQVWI